MIYNYVILYVISVHISHSVMYDYLLSTCERVFTCTPAVAEAWIR